MLMSRSQWKGHYALNKNDLIKKNQQRIILSRSAEIQPNLIGSSAFVYNGKILKELIITKEMIGYKAGEFCFTRAKFIFKKKNKKSK